MLGQDQNIDATQLSQPSSSKWCARLGSLGQKDQKWQGLFGLYDTFMHFVGCTQDTTYPSFPNMVIYHVVPSCRIRPIHHFLIC